MTTYINTTTRRSFSVFIGVSSGGSGQIGGSVDCSIKQQQILEELELVRSIHATTAQLA
jgi:hypothetical protein